MLRFVASTGSQPSRASLMYKAQKQSAKLLATAGKSLPILRSVRWNADIKRDFFANNAQKLPKPEYRPIDTKPARELIKSARKLLSQGDEIDDWLLRVCTVLQTTANMLDARGGVDFYHYSKKLYGAPENTMLDGKTRVIDLALHLDETLSGLENERLVLGMSDELMSAQEFADKLQAKLTPFFGADMPVIKLDDIASKALAGRKRIRINKAAKFNKMDVRQLIQHEAHIHIATALNGRNQSNFPVLGLAHAGTTEVQEGLAVFAEIITGAMDPARFKRLMDRVIAIDMVEKGADFIEVYRYFLEQERDEEFAFDDTYRVFRGGVLTGGAPFTKDGVYLNGLLRVHNFMRTVTKLKRADLLRILFVGKLDIEDIPALAKLRSVDEIDHAKYLPYWMRDMRFLVSYLSYSSFLNRVKLPGFQNYYKNMLSDVPKLW